MTVQQRNGSGFDEFRVRPQQLIYGGRKPAANFQASQGGGRHRATAFLLGEVFPSPGSPRFRPSAGARRGTQGG